MLGFLFFITYITDNLSVSISKWVIVNAIFSSTDNLAKNRSCLLYTAYGKLKQTTYMHVKVAYKLLIFLHKRGA